MVSNRLDGIENGGAYKGCQELEAAGLLVSAATDGRAVLENKRDFNDARESSGHQCVSKSGVHMGAQFEVLWVTTHGPASHEYDDCRYYIALRSAITLST